MPLISLEPFRLFDSMVPDSENNVIRMSLADDKQLLLDNSAKNLIAASLNEFGFKKVTAKVRHARSGGRLVLSEIEIPVTNNSEFKEAVGRAKQLFAVPKTSLVQVGDAETIAQQPLDQARIVPVSLLHDDADDSYRHHVQDLIEQSNRLYESDESAMDDGSVSEVDPDDLVKSNFEVCEHAPYRAVAWYNLAISYNETDDRELAIYAASNAVALAPDNKVYGELLREYYSYTLDRLDAAFNAGVVDGVINSYTQLCYYLPNDITLKQKLFATYLKTKKYQEAIVHIQSNDNSTSECEVFIASCVIDLISHADHALVAGDIESHRQIIQRLFLLHEDNDEVAIRYLKLTLLDQQYGAALALSPRVLGRVITSSDNFKLLRELLGLLSGLAGSQNLSLEQSIEAKDLCAKFGALILCKAFEKGEHNGFESMYTIVVSNANEIERYGVEMQVLALQKHFITLGSAESFSGLLTQFALVLNAHGYPFEQIDVAVRGNVNSLIDVMLTTGQISLAIHATQQLHDECPDDDTILARLVVSLQLQSQFSQVNVLLRDRFNDDATAHQFNQIYQHIFADITTKLSSRVNLSASVLLSPGQVTRILQLVNRQEEHVVPDTECFYGSIYSNPHEAESICPDSEVPSNNFHLS